MPEVRLQKILSAAGIASRRASERLIVEGHVTVNGTVVRELGVRADPDGDDIRVDGRRIRAAPPSIYLLLNKPAGYVSTRSDPQGRPTVLDLVGNPRQYMYPVGRLDFDSEGLLLLTNDGELAARLTHPRHAVEREYEVRVRGVPDVRAMERLSKGVTVEGRRTLPATVKFVRSTESRGRSDALLAIVIREGRKRQVRQMCDAIGHPVIRLRRVRIGPLSDSSLKPGHFRRLTPAEIARLKRSAT
jgi:pseudouridine synthase